MGKAIVLLIAAIAVLALLWALTPPANAHSWYTGEHNEVGHACCGGTDCDTIEERYVKAVPGGYQVDLPAGYRFDWPEIHAFVPNARAKPAPVGWDYHLCFWGGEVKCFWFPAPAF